MCPTRPLFFFLLDNLVSWERYERERDALADKLAAADTELVDTKKVFCMDMGPKDHADRVKTAAAMRKDIEGSFSAMVNANETLNQLLEDDMKMELADQVRQRNRLLEIKREIGIISIRFMYITNYIYIYIYIYIFELCFPRTNMLIYCSKRISQKRFHIEGIFIFIKTH